MVFCPKMSGHGYCLSGSVRIMDPAGNRPLIFFQPPIPGDESYRQSESTCITHVGLYASPIFSGLTFIFDLFSTFVLNSCGSALLRCMGMITVGLMAIAACTASFKSIVNVPPVGSKATSMRPNCFISGIKSVSPAW